MTTEDVKSTGLYAQIADALGWPLADAQRCSLVSLREVVCASVEGFRREALLITIDAHLRIGVRDFGEIVAVRAAAEEAMRAAAEEAMRPRTARDTGFVLDGVTTTLQDLDAYVKTYGVHPLTVQWSSAVFDGSSTVFGRSAYEVRGGAEPHVGHGNTLTEAILAFFTKVLHARALAADPRRERFADFVHKALQTFPDARVEEGPDGELVVYTNHRETKEGFVVPLDLPGNSATLAGRHVQPGDVLRLEGQPEGGPLEDGLYRIEEGKKEVP